MVNTHAKFEVSTLNRSWDMEGSQNSKSRSRDPFRPHWAYFWILFFFVFLMVNIRAKFKVSTLHRSQDIEWVAKF